MKLSEYQWSSSSLTLVKGHSDFEVKCLTFGLYTQVSNSGPLGPLVTSHFTKLNEYTPLGPLNLAVVSALQYFMTLIMR